MLWVWSQARGFGEGGAGFSVLATEATGGYYLAPCRLTDVGQQSPCKR